MNYVLFLFLFCFQEPFYLIMEYAPHGNLQNHLRGIRNAPESPYNNVESGRREFLTPAEILQFGSQIANGMMYLASKQVRLYPLLAIKCIFAQKTKLFDEKGFFFSPLAQNKIKKKKPENLSRLERSIAKRDYLVGLLFI